MSGLSQIIIITVMIVALIDFFPRLLVKRNPAIPVDKKYAKNRLNYKILPTVYGDKSYIEKFSTSFIARYARHITILTTRDETDEFYKALSAFCRKHNTKYVRVNMIDANGKRLPTNAYTLYRMYFRNYRARHIEGYTPCILIDADTYSLQSINSLVKTFNEHGLDMASLRCEISKPANTLEHLQAFEYTLAMDNRQVDHWLTSGACNMATAEIYQKVFSKHSNFFAGGDIEIGKIAQISGFKIRHIDFTFLTLAPDTFKDWFNQRTIWMSGGIRHHLVNLGSFSWHHLFITFYSSLLLFAFFPLRWIELVNYPITLPILIVLSWVYLFAFVARSKWHPRLLLLPFYSFMQTMVILPLAVRRYIGYAKRQNSLGILSYDLTAYTVRDRLLHSSLNILTGVVVIGLGLLLTLSRIAYWATN